MAENVFCQADFRYGWAFFGDLHAQEFKKGQGGHLEDAPQIGHVESVYCCSTLLRSGEHAGMRRNCRRKRGSGDIGWVEWKMMKSIDIGEFHNSV